MEKGQIKRIVQRIILTFLCSLSIFIINPLSVFAIGESGFFGGITEGVRLPKTTETLLKKDKIKPQQNITNMPYKEMVFVNGKAEEFSGLLNLSYQGGISDDLDMGTYRVTYQIRPNGESEASIDRRIVFEVNWRRVGSQIIRDYKATSWRENISGAGELNENESHYDISIIEDETPGVDYYKGEISSVASYGEGNIIHETQGSFYGYKSPWSKTETHRIEGWVNGGDWQLNYEVRPSVSMDKRLEYSSNEPTSISFPGNYREMMSNTSGLQYDIFVLPYHMTGAETKGQTNIKTHTTFEQLIAPDTSAFTGHFAEADIKKLYAMEVIEGNARFYQPNQAITRGQYVSMLTKALKIPIEEVKTGKRGKTTAPIVFPDVLPDRPDYPYIMAAYRSGLAHGRGQGHFFADYTLTRQEAIVLLVRGVGLGSLGLTPTPQTPFTDDEKVDNWAKREIYAAKRIGLAHGDEGGNLHPQDPVTKAEAAAMVNRLIEYMRKDLVKDYRERIVHFSQ